MILPAAAVHVFGEMQNKNLFSKENLRMASSIIIR